MSGQDTGTQQAGPGVCGWVDDVTVPVDLAALDHRALARHVGVANTAFVEARRTYEEACADLRATLTEQIAREVARVYPTASVLQVRAAAEFHHDSDGHVEPRCPGHEERLVPAEVLDGRGREVGHLEALSPVVFHLERLGALTGVQDAVLTLADREWVTG